MKRILIVDDAIDLGRLLQDALKTVHPDVPISVVPSAEEALLESTRFTIDVLVTDLRLPGMSGLDLIRKIRTRQPNVKVILMTGLNPDNRLYKQKDELALDIFLRKPIMPMAFLEAVDQLLGVSQEEQKTARGMPVGEAPAAAKTVDESLAGNGPAVKPVRETPAENGPAITEPVMDAQTLKGPEIEQPAAQATAEIKPAPVSVKELAQTAILDELAAVMPGLPVEATPPSQPITPVGMVTATLSFPSEVEPAPVETGLSVILSRLRGSLGAITTMLLDERGRPVEQAGDLPDVQVESLLVPPMMASLSAGAKISYVLGQMTTQLVQAYRGKMYDLVVTPIGQYVLLIALPVPGTGHSALRLALAFEEALNAQSEFSAALEAMGLRVQTAVEMGGPEMHVAEIPEIPLGQDPGLEKFEEMFKRKKTGELRLQDPDSFWDSASSEMKEVSQPGDLTYEQAQKLGLLPPEEET